ncbi:hypothetical protein CRENBAI_003143 [Crenichthys baileyi]|uniref:Uncharacterized protein n=1 Tax=Crenichthys baileyi TaxID=28760 RepID=A0AAV9S924_9TELE
MVTGGVKVFPIKPRYLTSLRGVCCDSCVLDSFPVRYLVPSRLKVFQKISSDKLQLAASRLLSYETLQHPLLTLHRARQLQVPTPVTDSPVSWKSLTQAVVISVPIHHLRAELSSPRSRASPPAVHLPSTFVVLLVPDSCKHFLTDTINLLLSSDCVLHVGQSST